MCVKELTFGHLMCVMCVYQNFMYGPQQSLQQVPSDEISTSGNAMAERSIQKRGGVNLCDESLGM